MKEILIISGKGGTGKTSISACFAQLSSEAVFCDCDVDASNMHLLLTPENSESHDFFAGWAPQIDTSLCSNCGKCAEVCRFNAVALENDFPEIIGSLCEGCGVCADHCPASAVKLAPRHCGRWYFSETQYGPLFHAELFPGEENSGKLIAELRKAAKLEAGKRSAKLIISDGPPGIGCPVISSMSGVDLVIAVTEPTPSGLHDLKRVALLAHQFEIPVQVIINKYDINTDLCGKIEDFCRSKNFAVTGQIAYDPVFPEQLRKGETVLSLPDSAPALKIREIWHKINSILT